MFKVHELLKATGGRLICGRKNLSFNGVSIDSRTIRQGNIFIALKGNNFDGHDFIDEAIKKKAGCIIQERRVKIPYVSRQANGQREVIFIEVKDTQKALGDIALFQRKKFNIPLIAITGSNGKTTTKDMLSWTLSRHFKVLKNEGTKNNQIGLPLTLLNLNNNHDIAVLEIGTNHSGEVDYLAKISQANIGIITNIGPSHLEYLHNLNGVFKEKYTLIKNLKKPDIAILNADDGLLRHKTLSQKNPPFILSFGIKKQGDFFASDIKDDGRRLEFKVNKKYKFILHTLGYYNIYNALAAIAVARIFGMSYKDIMERLSNFDFPPGRLKMRELNKIKFIDDTYNSNPLSLKQALGALRNFKTKGRKIFVMGDMLELGNQARLFHYRVGRQVMDLCDTFITVGKLSRLSAQAAKKLGFNTKNIFTCESRQEAQNILFNKISPKEDDVVLIKGSRSMKMEEILKP